MKSGSRAATISIFAFFMTGFPGTH